MELQISKDFSGLRGPSTLIVWAIPSRRGRKGIDHKIFSGVISVPEIAYSSCPTQTLQERMGKIEVSSVFSENSNDSNWEAF